MSESKIFTLYWRTGRREIVHGKDPADAMNRAGYGGGAVRALDLYAEGDNHEWEWRASEHEWFLKVSPTTDR